MMVPVNVTIQRASGQWELIEIVPLCIEQHRALMDTGVYQLYAGFPEFDELENFDEDSPHFLGELRFLGFAYFEWEYTGHRLNETEVEHIVDLIQSHNRSV